MNTPGRAVGEGRHADDVPDDNKEFKVRVHDHDEHLFESPPPLAPTQQGPFKPKSHRYIPIVVPIIMVGNIVVFILLMYSNNCPKHVPKKSCVGSWLGPLSFQPWNENPMLGPTSSKLLSWGALESNLVTKHGHHQGWRLVSAIALNGGVLQLIITLLTLLVVGIPLELTFWFTPVGLIYLFSGFGGSLLSALFIQNQVFAGASGAVMGLLGAGISEIITNWERTERKWFKIFDLVLFMAINFAFGLMPQVDNFANVGGLLTGFLLGFILFMRPQIGFKDTRHLSQLEAFMVNQKDADLPPVRKHKGYQKVFLVIALVLVVGLLTAACVVLFLGLHVNKHCKWCHYMACVPKLKWTCQGTYIST